MPSRPSRARLLPLVPLLGLLACASGEAEPDALAAALAAEARGAQAAADHVNAIADPAEQVLVLNYLLQERPQSALAMCPLLASEKLQGTCRERAGRAHLWTTPSALEVVEGAGASGPPTHQLAPADSLRSRYEGVPADAGACTEEAARSTCATHAASEAAKAGDPSTAAARCAAVEAGPLRDECSFLASEALMRLLDPAQVAPAAELCLAAGGFRSRCFAHMVLNPTLGVAPADRPEVAAGSWASRRAVGEAIEAWWQERQPDSASIAHQRFWAGATFRAYARAETVTGDLLDLLPAAEHAHVRAAAAWKLLQGQDPGQHDLDAWVALLSEALAARSVEAATGPRSGARQAPAAGTLDLWPPSEPGEPGMTALVYLGNSRRVVSEDEASDLAICVLEAAARAEGSGGAELLRGASSHPSAEVAWTAKRLLRQSQQAKGSKAGPRPPMGQGAGAPRPSPPHP